MLYLAAPLWVYPTLRYQQALDQLTAEGHDVADVRGMYSGNRDWTARWPVERDRYSSIWVVTGDQGWIGKATDVELTDLRDAGRPCWWWNHRTTEFELGPTTGSWKRWRRLHLA